MGEPYAVTMGVNVKVLRVAIILISGLLTAVVTAFAGPVSFIGMSVPHICRMILKRTIPGTDSLLHPVRRYLRRGMRFGFPNDHCAQ